MNREQGRDLKAKFKKKSYNFASILQGQIIQSDIDGIVKFYNLILEDKKLSKLLNLNYLPTSVGKFGEAKFIFEQNADNKVLTQWVIYLFRFYSDKINKFVNLKIQYENALFCENYNSANKLLIDIEDEVCVSMWSICQRFVLEEKINGLASNKKLLSQTTNRTKKNPLLAILFEYSSIRAEENMSYLNYQDQAVKYLKSLENNKTIQLYCDFKINNDYVYTSSVFGIALQLDSQMSIIDIYETFIRLIQYQSFSNLEVMDSIKMISEYIDDFRISNLLITKQTEEFIIKRLEVNKDSMMYEYLDLYSEGKYNELIYNYCKENLEKNIDFQSLILYIKSCLNSNSEMAINITIAKLIKDVYSLNGNSLSSINQLYNFLNTYKDTRWYDKLRGFLSHKLEIETNKNLHYLSLINDLYLTPNFIEFIGTTNERNIYLSYCTKVCPITASLFKYKYCGEVKDDNFHKVASLRKILFEADASISNENYSAAIENLTNIQSLLTNNNFMLEKILTRLFKAYCLNHDYMKAVNLTVDSYFANPEIIRKFNVNSIITKVKRTRDLDLKKSIYSPIFTHITQPLNLKNQRVVISNFMGHNNYFNFDDMFIRGKYDENLLCYFIHKICTLHFLNRDPEFAKTPEEAENVRIKLLWKLLEINSKNSKQYYDEISKIMLEKSIRNNISKINQSKVTVEVDKIKLECYDILNENFEKYLSMKEFDDDYETVDITNIEYANNILESRSKVNENTRTEKNYSQKVIVLRKILVSITEEFLFNTKYGLDTYLSSRIRHGYCRYQLTDSFIDYNLLSKTRSDNSKEFIENEYWDKKLESHGIECTQTFKSYISKFTSNIEYKVNEVKNQWIKICYKPDDIGLLDFTVFIEQLVSKLYEITFNDFEIFFSSVIREFCICLETSLEKLRLKITTELYEFFILELSSLEKNIQSINEYYMKDVKREVLQNINLCKRKIENDTNEFANVLYKNDIKYKDFYMDALVTTSTEISSKLNSNFKNVLLKKEINVNELINGELFPYFVDILNMLITNANIHSGYKDLSELQIDINIDIVENLNQFENIEDNTSLSYEGFNKKHIKFSVINSLSTMLNLVSVKKKIGEKIDNLSDKDIVRKHSRMEGGTGIYKIYNILKYNISGGAFIVSDVQLGKFIFEIYIPYETVVKGDTYENTLY